MIGLPTETKEEMLETARLNSRLRPYIVWLSTFMPYPGTELYDFCKEQNLIDEGKWDEVYSYRGNTVLNQKYISNLEFNKIRILFKWYLNAFLNMEVSETYRKNIDELNKVSDDRWDNGEVQKIYAERDSELDHSFRQKKYGHYVSKKYVFIFWDKMYDFDLS